MLCDRTVLDDKLRVAVCSDRQLRLSHRLN